MEMHRLGKNIYHIICSDPPSEPLLRQSHLTHTLFKLIFAILAKTWKRAWWLRAMWRGKMIFQCDFADAALKPSS